MSDARPKGPLRYGWTTGACATAAAKSAYAALITGEFLDPVTITLPRGQTPAFALAYEALGDGVATAGIVKDAGDDPDVTHGLTVMAEVRKGPPGSGVHFEAGEGVGMVTLKGLPIPPGEPAINPVPREMMRQAISEIAADMGASGDVVLTLSIPGGREVAAKTWNPRLGIVGGLSILGTTGVVTPYSCAAWIHSIHRGVDVAREAGLSHIAGSTGNMSEQGVQNLHDLPEIALMDMGDFVGGLLKYVKKNPVPNVTIAGGPAKLTKLAHGALDLHSRAGGVRFDWLAEEVEKAGGTSELVAKSRQASTALEVFQLCEEANIPLGVAITTQAWKTASEVLSGTGIKLEVAMFDRSGALLTSTGLRKTRS